MLGKQAKTLAPGALRRAQEYLRQRPLGLRDEVLFLLSARAGLRACEIAGLQWSMVLKAQGLIGDHIEVRAQIAKMASGRRVPMHADLRAALGRLKASLGAELVCDAPVIPSAKSGHLRPNSIVNWFKALYGELGLEGCSSHSGRRTFITNAARNAHRAGASLRDVQLLAGHRSIEMTQRYIDGDSDAQRRLIRFL